MTILVQAQSSAAIDQVWDVLSDLDAWPEWLPTVSAINHDPQSPRGEGAAYRVKQPRLPTARWVVTDWRAGQCFTWRSTSPGVRTIATHELRATEESGTDIVLTITWSGPLSWLARSVYGRMTRRYVEVEAKALVARSEGAPRQTR